MSEDNDVVARASRRIGTVLRGKYRIDRILGVGGMATVYAATHRNQAQFAVKLLHPEISSRDDVRSRFLREGYVANSVKHPGSVLVVDDDVDDDGAAFLVMELLEGSTVEELCERSGNKMRLDAAVAIIDQLLDILAAAHAKSIVHRDIKPANLFVTRESVLKVLDFGIARARDAAASSTGHGTGTGMLLGTPAYMAPEQALAKSSDIDAQTDLWAVGATLFTLLAGRIVHDGDNGPQLLIAAATTPARSLGVMAPETPEAIVQVVDRALAFNKADRWPTATAMREGLATAWKSTTGERPSRLSLQPFFAVNTAPMSITSAGLAPTAAVEDAPAIRVAVAATPPSRVGTPVHATQKSPSQDDRASSSSSSRPQATTTAALTNPSLAENSVVLPKQRTSLIAAVAVGALVAAGGVGWGVFGHGHGASEAPASAAPLATTIASVAEPRAAATKDVPAVALAALPNALPAPSVVPPAPASASATAPRTRAVGAGAPVTAGAPRTAPAPSASAHGIPIQW